MMLSNTLVVYIVIVDFNCYLYVISESLLLQILFGNDEISKVLLFLEYNWETNHKVNY